MRRLSFVLLLAMVASASAEEKIEALRPVDRANAKWWTSRHQEKLDAIKSAEKNIDLVFIGDSITHGWEGKGQELWKEKFSKYNALNLGYSGDRTEHVLWRFEHGELDGYKPKVAVVMIGTNNTGHRQAPAKNTAAGVQAIVEGIHAKHPETKVLLLAIFPRGATTEDKLRVINADTNAMLKGFCKEKDYVEFVDLNPGFLEEDGTLPKSIMPDLLHPNAKGYQIWADAIAPKIDELLN